MLNRALSIESCNLRLPDPGLNRQMLARQEFEVAGGVKVRLEGDSHFEWGEREELLANAYLPGYRRPGSGSKPDIDVRHHESAERHFASAGSNASIQDCWNNSPNLDLFHLLYAMSRIEMLKRGMFPVHSCCAGEQEHVLIVGPSGTGKTSILLNLMERLPGWKVFSSNKTAVSFTDGRMAAVAGTRTISRRAADADRGGGEYGDRVAYMLPEAAYAPQPHAPIRAIVFTRLNDGYDRVERLTPESALHLLYPYFLDALNADVVMAGGGGSFYRRTPAGNVRASRIRSGRRAPNNPLLLALGFDGLCH